MDPAYWAWKDRNHTPVTDPELAEYLRNEFPDGSGAAFLVPSEPDRDGGADPPAPARLSDDRDLHPLRDWVRRHLRSTA